MKTTTQPPVTPGEEVQAAEKKKPNARQILNTVVNVILVIALIAAAMCTYVSFVSASGNGVPSILGVEFFSIQTDSMSPTLNPGDLAIGRVIKDKTSLRPGDIITYWTVINGERVLNTVHESEVVGKYASRVPSVGKVLDYLQTSTGFLIVIVIPVFLFFLYHLVQFFRVLFEYQNVKNRLRYEEERGRTEDIIEEKQREQEDARAQLEAQLREQLRAEMMAEMAKKAEEAAAPATEPVAEEEQA